MRPTPVLNTAYALLDCIIGFLSYNLSLKFVDEIPSLEIKEFYYFQT